MIRFSIGSTGTFVKGSEGNLAETSEKFGMGQLSAQDIENMEIAEEVEAMRGYGNCSECDDFEGTRECYECSEQRRADRIVEMLEKPAPIDFQVTVKRLLPRDERGALMLTSLQFL